MSAFDHLPEVDNTALNVTPGEILQEEFLEPLGISAYRLAKETRLSAMRISEIINKQRAITAETAVKFSKFFGNSPQFWLNLQTDYEIYKAKEKYADELELIKQL